MNKIKFLMNEPVPLEMHKVRIVQSISLPPLNRRIKANRESGNNPHLLKNEDVFLDMLTDSGTNAMSDRQLAAMMEADDAYAGSSSFYKLEAAVQDAFGMRYFLPAHQGRACEHLICLAFMQPGQIAAMNYHFTTVKAHILARGGRVRELITDGAVKAEGQMSFKGDVDIEKLESLIEEKGADNIAFLRIEAGTNLIGGQPVSLKNMDNATSICRQRGILTILDASLLSDNVYFNKLREAGCQNLDPKDIVRKISACFDMVYFSGRKLTSSRGGGMCFRDEKDYLKVKDMLPLYEGFLTYGGISVREMEAMAVGMEDLYDEDFISQGPIFTEHMCKLLSDNSVPIVTPPGGLGVHLDAKRFLPHISPKKYPAAALGAALYLAGGIRGTERGTLSEDRDENGDEVEAKMELLRLALPRRVFTLSQIHYAVDRICWLYENRELIGGLEFVSEPKTMRFFFGKLAPEDSWQRRLVRKLRADESNAQ